MTRAYVSSGPYLALSDENGRTTWLQRETLLEACASLWAWASHGAPSPRVIDRRGVAVCWCDVQLGSWWTDEVGELMRQHSPAMSEITKPIRGDALAVLHFPTRCATT